MDNYEEILVLKSKKLAGKGRFLNALDSTILNCQQLGTALHVSVSVHERSRGALSGGRTLSCRAASVQRSIRQLELCVPVRTPLPPHCEDCGIEADGAFS